MIDCLPRDTGFRRTSRDLLPVLRLLTRIVVWCPRPRGIRRV